MRLSIRRWGLAAAVAILVALWGHSDVDANHLQWLPGSCGQDVRSCPTPVIQKAITRGYVTYDLDAQTAAYPNFRAQAQQVAAAGLQGLGIEAREVTTGADIHLTMPDDATFIKVCGSGAAGCIVYWSDPIVVYFRKSLLYTDWKTAIGHEGLNYGHALGQHERYFDNGEFRCDTTARYTVMSCGTGVWEPQPFDVETVCAVIKTSWCGQAPSAPWPRWNGSRWVYEDGRSTDPAYGNCGGWYNAANQLVLAQCDKAWNGRYVKAGSNDESGIWMHVDTPENPSSAFTFGEWWTVIP